MKARICFTVGLILGFSLTAWSQERITKVVPRTYSLPIPQMDKGIVEGRTYKNPSIGIEFTLPVGLTFGTPELKGTPGRSLFVTVAALGEKSWIALTRDTETFLADALAYYPDGQRSTEACLRQLVRGNQEVGFEIVKDAFEEKLSGIPFSRMDFKKWPVYEAVLAKACTAQAFTFIFAGADRDAVNRLISKTNLKLDRNAGCDSGAGGTKK